jgi:hypothetical protein
MRTCLLNVVGSFLDDVPFLPQLMQDAHFVLSVEPTKHVVSDKLQNNAFEYLVVIKDKERKPPILQT